MNPHAAVLETVLDGNIVLGLNSESAEKSAIDFHVFIDGHPAYSGEIEPTPHQIKYLQFTVRKGPHAVYVHSKKLDTWAAQSVEVNQKTWVYISYWECRQPEMPLNPQFHITSRLAPAPIY